MTRAVFQAMVCFLAARSLSREYHKATGIVGDNAPVFDADVHAVANGMGDCTTFSTHKYMECDPINKFMDSKEGSGVYGFWSFKDGSKLVVSCGDRYTMITFSEDNKKRFLRDISYWPNTKTEEQDI